MTNATLAMGKCCRDSTPFHVDTLSPQAILEWAACRFGQSLAMTTSFGIQSAVLLHMATRVQPAIPVLWIDTGYLPKATYDYADQLTSLLGLRLQTFQADMTPARMEAKFGRLWESESTADLNLYDRIRKVDPLQRAFEELRPSAWLSGVRRQQTSHRQSLQRIRHDGVRYRVLPLLDWTTKEIYDYMVQHDLPQHPLWERGFSTVGDWHSSRPMSTNDNHERETRFRGLKEECGIHI